MTFSEYVQNITEDNHTVLTVVIPAGVSRKQIRQFVHEETQKLLGTENAKFEYVAILLALLLRVESDIHFYKDVTHNSRVYCVSRLINLNQQTLPVTESWLLAKNPPNLIHQWGNYPAFELFAHFLKE